MSLTFLLDEDLSYRVAEGLRQRGVDVLSVHEVGRANRKVSDAEQLEYATQQGRVLVTYNRADYQALDATWRARVRGPAAGTSEWSTFERAGTKAASSSGTARKPARLSSVGRAFDRTRPPLGPVIHPLV